MSRGSVKKCLQSSARSQGGGAQFGDNSPPGAQTQSVQDKVYFYTIIVHIYSYSKILRYIKTILSAYYSPSRLHN